MEYGWDIAVDASGAAYVTGYTQSDEVSFPVLGGPDLTYSVGGYSGYDAFVAKVKPDGSGLEYAGYIGGNGDDFGRDIAVDASGAAYVVGSTQSDENSFPVLGGPDLTYNGKTDTFVAKVQPNGSGLVYAGYIGGSDQDSGYSIAVNSNGAAYVVGDTASDESDFPVLGGLDSKYNGHSDAYVAKVHPDGNRLAYAGYIGGNGTEWAADIAIDASGAAYVVGVTTSDESSFPVLNGPDLTYNGGFDAFVAKVEPYGRWLVYVGYIGGSGSDRGNGIDVDASGAAYVIGATNSDESSFPVLGGPDLTHDGGGIINGRDAFVTKVQPDGSGLVYAGYIGGSGDDYARGIAVDASGAAYVVGDTTSDENSFPVLGGPDLTHNGGDDFGQDAFVAKVGPDGSGLVYAGFIGGSNDDVGNGISVDSSGAAYVIGFSTSDESSFPVLGGPDLIYNGDYDAFVAKISEMLPICYALTVAHTGNGSYPTASPSNSSGCSAGQYVAGEIISLSGAVPDSGWEISGWSGTDDDSSTSNSNTVTMPASAHSASVAYTEFTPTFPVGPGTYENDDANISYAGSWATTTSSNSSGGSTSHSNDPDASASLSFYGGQVSLLYTGYSNRGEIEISIDGGTPQILNQHTSVYTYQNRWDSQLLDTSLHTITLSHPGDTTTIDLDALIVAPHNPTGNLIKSIDQLSLNGELIKDYFPYTESDYVVWDSDTEDISGIYLYQISTGITTQIGNEGLLPKVSGNHVIWSGCGGVCLYQIDTGTTRSIADASMEYPQEPYIDGDNIVWSSDLDGDVEIYRYQISTDTKTQITNNSTVEYYPYIQGDSIVWAGMTNGHDEIFLHRISTGTTTQISNNEFELNWWPQPSGDYVVWFGDDYDGDSEIMLYQISTGTTTQITDNAIDDDYPEIDGNYIVWGQNDGSHFTRHLYVINTGQTKQISPDSTYASRTRNIIKGDFVTWSNFAGYPAEEDECYLYQISTDTLNLVAENSLGSPYPHLSEAHLVWNANYDIFLAELDIPEDTPPAAVILNAATGTYPGEVVLSWTAPGADGNTGTATEYIVRYADAEIADETAWDAAADVNNEPVPQIAGTEESMTVSGLAPVGTYYFALRTLDESGNLSDLSNSPVVEMQFPPPVGPGTYENDDVHIISAGNWTTWNHVNASGGSTRYSDDPEASATLLFYGGQVSLIFTGDTDRGDVEILIDDKLMPGVEPDVVSQYSSSTTFQNRWDSPMLDIGLHNITVQHPGGTENIDLDAFIVAPHHPTGSLIESIDQLTINDTVNTANNEWYPSIDGDYIVWMGDYDISGIFLHQISTGETTKIANGGWHPQIHGNNVVWECGDVCLYQIASELTTVIEDDDDYGDGGQYPQVYGDYVIFTSNQDGDNEIYRYQISTGVKSRLTNNDSGDFGPDIEGDYVVWSGVEGEDNDIYLHQLSTDTIINLTNDQAGNFAGAHISGDYVVWVSYGPSGLYLYQISTATTTQITNDSTGDNAPEIDGNYIVWLKSTSQSDVKDIYLHDIQTGISKKIASTGTNFIWDLDTGPYVKDDFVFWMSRDGSPENDNEVYLYQISTDTIHNISDNLDAGDGHAELDGNHLVWSGDYEIYLATLDTSDTIPPAAVNLSAATGSETGEVNLDWIAPGDNGNTGTATEYILRYADTAIDSESAWNSASEVTGEPVPQIAGSAETLTVSDLTPGETYYFALRTMDSDANLSELSNSPSAVAKAPSYPGVGTYENDNANIIYTGTWYSWNDAKASGGSFVYTNEPGASATLTFTGRQVKLVFNKYTNRGNIQVVIDGGAPVLVSQYSTH